MDKWLSGKWSLNEEIVLFWVSKGVKSTPNLEVVHVIYYDTKFDVTETILHYTLSLFYISDPSFNEKIT